MNMVIGFGSTEQGFEAAEENAIRDFAAKTFVDMDCNYVSDELAEALSTWLCQRGEALREKADQYKTAETYPHRYSYFWAKVIHGASDLVAIVNFSHINRRHALSPDGWALMQSTRLVHIDYWALVDARKAGA